MQFALVNNERSPPSPGLIGACPACGSPMISRCGNERVHHWAHRGFRTCDPWWETETEWHRAWKNKFPSAWRERVRFDDFGEKHIADVLTEHGLTIEFQHSHLNPAERAAREAFYNNMVWVVDGSRLKRDARRFEEAFRSFGQLLPNGMFVTPFPEEAFPRTWLSCTVPVFFDFANANALGEAERPVGVPLWCLLPGLVHNQAVVLAVSREVFLRDAQAMAVPFHAQAMRGIAERVLAAMRAKQLADVRAAQLRQMAWSRKSSYRRRLPRF